MSLSKCITLIILVIFPLYIITSFTNCCNVTSSNSNKNTQKQSVNKSFNETDKKEMRNITNSNKQQNYKVTFIELGSVGCIPCKMMKPIIKEIENEYGNQIKVIFYDVWTPEGQPYAKKYGIKAIPTQVFLDSAGNEFFRHQGFFPKKEIINLLKQHGVN